MTMEQIHDAGPPVRAGRQARAFAGGEAIARLVAALFTMAGWVLFVAGVLLPVVAVRRLQFWTDEPSLLAIIASLLESSDYFLAAVVLTFSIIFPTLKLGYLSLISAAGPSATPQIAIDHMGWLGRWSMMDVLLVAIAVFAAKTTGFASALSQPGVWAYGGAVICSAIAAEVLKYGIRRRTAPQAASRRSARRGRRNRRVAADISETREI